jgi:protein-tyrosine phosphatase
MEGTAVLMVCFGNICRSPTAEGVLRHLARREAPGLELTIDSAGTSDYHLGAPPDERSQHHARLRGIDISDLRARQVVARDYRDFDLILAMDRDNLRTLKQRLPLDARARLKLFLEYAPELQEIDVPDPYYGDAAGFERVLDLTMAGARGLLKSLQQRA